MNQRIFEGFKKLGWMVVAIAIMTTGGVACNSAAQVPSVSTPALVPRAQVLVLGDIDADDPGKKLQRFQPLADYLAMEMEHEGVLKGRVVIARDISEMGQMMVDGQVDVYFDSPYPTLAVRELSGSKIILRRWKNGIPEYWSVLVARNDRNLSTASDLTGKILAVEEPYSTSGFLLPVGTLVQRGLDLKVMDSLDALVETEQVGYFFTGDEENVVEMVLRGQADAGALSNLDYNALSSELTAQLVPFDRTATVPRQLVSVRPGLEEKRVDRLRELLIGLDQTEEGRGLLADLKKTSKFDPVPPESNASLMALDHMIS